jgi:hypothetical protein
MMPRFLQTLLARRQEDVSKPNSTAWSMANQPWLWSHLPVMKTFTHATHGIWIEHMIELAANDHLLANIRCRWHT